LSQRSGPIYRPSESYDAYWSEHGGETTPWLLSSFREILERNVRPQDNCIDVGCGPGNGAGSWLVDNTTSYIGVDVSERALSAARAAGLTVQHIEDASDLPFADDTFAVAVCVEVFEHLLHPQLAAREIHRVLRPGGHLIATVPNVAYWRRRIDIALLGRWNPLGDDQSAHRPWRDPHLRFFGRANLGRMLHEAGYDPVATGGHGGSVMMDIPGLRKMARRPTVAGPIYKHLVALVPSVFAQRLHAIATKPPNTVAPSA
jgi:SAM-dependent methyltransferase